MYQRILKLKYRLARIWQAVFLVVLSWFFYIVFLPCCHGSFVLCFFCTVTALLYCIFYFTFTIVFARFFPAFTVMIAFPFLRALTFTEIFLAAFVVFLMVTIFFFEEVTVTLSVVFFEATVFVTRESKCL